MKAVIPAAGFGTRFLPATKAQPKEMMPILSKPAIQYVVEEAVNSGCDDILIVTGRHKRSIENHFDRSPELEAALAARHEEGRLSPFFSMLEGVSLFFVRQPTPAGLGDAVLRAEKHVNGEYFAVLLGDDVTWGEIEATKELIEVHKKTGRGVIGLERVPWEKVERYGIVAPEEKEEGSKVFELMDMKEKPALKEAPSNLAIAGRYILPPEIFRYLRETKRGVGGEIQLTDAIKHLNDDLIREGKPFMGCVFSARRYDTGNVVSWLKTNIHFALKSEETAEEIKRFLREVGETFQ